MVVLFPSLTVAQGTQEVADIITLSIVYHINGDEDRDADRSIRFDPRVLEIHVIDHPAHPEPIESYEYGEVRDPLLTDLILRGFDGELGSMDTDRVCATYHPRSCRLPWSYAVVAASEPVIDGDIATLVVTSQTRLAHEKMPVVMARARVTLEQSATGWKVRDSIIFMIT